ncbi:MAG: cytochrome c prime [Nevskia sp.]|nr:cytochrome c prime [Nevskia sp.]
MKPQSVTARRIVAASCVLILSTTFTFAVAEEAPAPAAASPAAKQAIQVRQAIFTLIGNNFKPVGETLQGKTPYDANDIQKRTARVAFLAPLLTDAFPDISSSGDTKAKPEIWSNRAYFDRKLKDFQDHTVALAQVADKDKSGSDAFKTAAAAVGKDCKGCHEDYKAK